MRHAREIAVLALVFSLTHSGCSLMNLDDLDAPECESNSDCAEAQARAGLDPSLCGHCVDKLCDFQHREETCNGKDDDCDGLIDEDVTVSPRRIAGVRTPTGPVAFATSTETPSTTYVINAGGAPHGFVIDEGGGVTPGELFFQPAEGDPNYPCRQPTEVGGIEVACDFTELAAAVDTEHVFYALINRSGCTEGQLRVGVADRRASPFQVQLVDPQALSPKINGDLAPVSAADEACLGKSIPIGNSGALPEGARGPAIATIHGVPGVAGALVAWVGASAAAEVLPCTDAVSVAVQALGVFVAPEAKEAWSGTNDAPTRLGMSSSLAPPAVVAFPAAEGAPTFLVGFASEEGGERGVRLVLVGTKDRALHANDFAFIPAASAEQVKLALGDVDASGHPTVGVLWTAPCESATSLHFATVSSASEAVTAVTLRTSSLLQAPQLLFRSAGFSVPQPHGGWFVLWAQQARGQPGEARLARLVDGAREPLNVVTLTSGTIGSPFLLPGEGESIRQTLLQESEIESEAVGTPIEWCGVRG